jgi:uncharacterized membrane protein SirB2
MKVFFKAIFTLEPPIGEAWLVIAGVLILATLGFVSFSEAGGWILAALLLAGIVICGVLIQMWWQRSKSKD